VREDPPGDGDGNRTSSWRSIALNWRKVTIKSATVTITQPISPATTTRIALAPSSSETAAIYAPSTATVIVPTMPGVVVMPCARSPRREARVSCVGP
jgi:hypothetical protein